MVRKAISFALVGVVNTLVDAGLFFLALAYLTSSLVAANVLAWSIAVSCSYVMNSFVTFAAESGRKLRLWDYGRFVGSSVLAMVASTATLVVAARYLGLPVYAAKGLAIAASGRATTQDASCSTTRANSPPWPAVGFALPSRSPMAG